MSGDLTCDRCGKIDAPDDPVQHLHTPLPPNGDIVRLPLCIDCYEARAEYAVDDARRPWVMPAWMKPFDAADLIFGHGGNGVVDLMNRLKFEKNLGFTNAIVLSMALQISAQVALLSRLRRAGLLVVDDLGIEPPMNEKPIDGGEYDRAELDAAAAEIGRGPYAPVMLRPRFGAHNRTDGMIVGSTTFSIADETRLCGWGNDEVVDIARKIARDRAAEDLS